MFVCVSVLACALAGCMGQVESDEDTNEATEALTYDDCLNRYEACTADCYENHQAKLATCNTGCETERELCAERASRPQLPPRPY